MHEWWVISLESTGRGKETDKETEVLVLKEGKEKEIDTRGFETHEVLKSNQS